MRLPARRVLIATAQAALCAVSAVAMAQTVAITGARAWTLTGPDPVENATIVLRDGRIVSVTAGAPAPGDARVIEAHGRAVTPGLMNAATQVGLVEVASVGDTVSHSVATGPLGAAFDVQYAIDPNSLLIQQARADGVTRAMLFPGGSAGAPFAGAGALIRLAEGPRLLERPKAAMFVVTGGAAAARLGGSRSAQWILLRNALDEARVYRAQRRSTATRDQLLNRLDVEALQPVIAGSMPLAVVAQRESDIRQAVQLGQEQGLRIVILGGAEAWRAAALLRSTSTAVVLDPLAGLPMSFDEIGARPDNAALLAQAGVAIAFSVPGAGIYLSYNAGPALREAAGYAVANGLSYVEALAAITVGAARIWGVADRFGRLAAGQDADLVIWDGDPLEPGTAPVAVFVGGREVSLVTRQSELRDRYAPGRMQRAWPPAYP